MKRKITILLLFFTFYQTFAATIYVTPNGTGNGTSWAQAYGSLSSALQNAQSGDEIWVAQGTYFPSSTATVTDSFIFKNGVKLYGGFLGTETELSNRADITGTTTLLSGEIAENIHSQTILKVANATSPLNLIDGFTIKGGYQSITTLAHGGVGMQVLNSSIILKNVNIKENTMEVTEVFSTEEVYVGGIGLYSFNSNITLEDVNITDNLLELTHSTQVSSMQGGVGYFAKGGSVSFTGGSIKSNTASFSGFFVYGVGGFFVNANSVYIANVLIKDNTANGSLSQPQGGGLNIFTCPDVEIINSIFDKNYTSFTQSNNVVAECPGSALMLRSVTAVITNVTFGKNATYSSTKSIKDGYSNLTFNNCIFTDRFEFSSATVSTFNHCISQNVSAGSDITATNNYTLNGFIQATIEFINVEKGNYTPKYCNQHLNEGGNSYNPLTTDF